MRFRVWSLGLHMHRGKQGGATCTLFRETGISLPNNQLHDRTLHIQNDVLPYVLCWLLCPVLVALASIFRMDSISTSYCPSTRCSTPLSSKVNLSHAINI